MKLRKSNIEIVKGYLAGERPFTQVGYVPPTVKYKDGEEWTDASGKSWKMVNGNKISVNKQAELIRNLSRQKCSCGQEIQYGTKLDEKFFLKTGKCFDCIVKEETDYRILGVYPQYEVYKMLSNYLGFLLDMQQKIKDGIKYLEQESGPLKVVCNGEGFIEKFHGMNTTELLETARKDYEEISKTIKTVTKDKNKAKRKFESDLKKVKAQLSKK